MNQIKLKLPPFAVKNGVLVKLDDLAITVPFSKVRKLRMKMTGMAGGSESVEKRESALLQYDLLLLEAVLRASVNAEKGEVVIVYDGKKTSAQDLVQFAREKLKHAFPNAGVSLAEDAEFDYSKLVEEGYHSQSS